MIIKVLGSGCANCSKLMKHVQEAVLEAGVQADVIKVEDFREIMAYGVMKTPALVIDEKVVSKGSVPSVKDIVALLGK